MLQRIVVTSALAFLPVVASAHGFGQRIDLPIPLALYLVAAAVVVVLSFGAIGIFAARPHKKAHATYPRLDIGATALGRIVTHTYLIRALQVIVGVVTICGIYAGFVGSQNPVANILPTLVWIYFSVGVVFFSALVGDIWRVVNPFRILASSITTALQRVITIQQLQWTPMLGVWPALIGFFLFRWVENIYHGSGDPMMLAVLISVYTIGTLYGSLVFGVTQWFQKGDPFAVFFRFLSLFSITEYESDAHGTRRLYLRPPLVGLFKADYLSSSETVFVLFMLGSVAFDSAREIPLWQAVQQWGVEIGITMSVIDTLGLVGILVLFLATYLLTLCIGRFIIRDFDVIAFAKASVLSLLPISVGYELAHFTSLLLTEGQRIGGLISDPFGHGWNLFGTAGMTIDYTILNFNILWHWQVFAIVGGHIGAMLVAHMIALRFFPQKKIAALSQFPMLILMVLYTVFSLWLLAQPIT